MVLIIYYHIIKWVDSLEKTLMLKKIEGRRRRGWQDEMVGWHHRLSGHESEQALGDSGDRGAWRAAVHEVSESWTWLSDWTLLPAPSFSLFPVPAASHILPRGGAQTLGPAAGADALDVSPSLLLSLSFFSFLLPPSVSFFRSVRH